MVVTFSPPSPDVAAAISQRLQAETNLVYLPELPESERGGALSAAEAILAWNLGAELADEGHLRQLGSQRLIQLLSAGADHVPFDRLPEGVPVASNAGAYAEPMAEHVLAMALALAKRLPQNHAALSRGEFDQQTPTRAIAGTLVGVLGFGGIGQASARLFRALGASVWGVNRSGRAHELADRMSTLEDLDAVLPGADILVISLPLTRATRELIGRRELSLLKADAILVNVARAAIVDEDALYEHLERNPAFSAAIDTWWQEPRHGGSFATRRPFFQLPNVLGSPHNSALTEGTLAAAAGRAAKNILRALHDEPVQHLVDRAEYV